ncbi:fused DSP-PTPase phosphatase/NAD kinase-like protein [Azohydromonas sediminis]|uniref:fused DSP-PTPase phosphatase/NAD kinase-like protein n=1 Tax=Azohydromonas sediminis TaxID=2259674 RepID=UPI000E657CBC|nr:tyrosine-protein phosphatase [Azohydromonas sediminis]
MSHDLTRPLGRLLAHLDMHLVDHGVVRAVYNNFHPLGGGMYRLSQPSPAQLRRYHRRYGIRTVVNLRGENAWGSYALEVETCRELGITLVNHRLYSRRLPTVDEVLGLRDVFARIEYPALMHCKSGADRAGLAAALYRHFQMGDPIETSARQLRWIYGHFRMGDTAKLDHFFDRYLADGAVHGIAFVDWLTTRYDRAALDAEFERHKPSALGRWFVDRVLRRE